MGEDAKTIGKTVSETVSSKRSVIQTFDFLLIWFFGLVMLAAAIPHWENPYYFLGSVYSYNLTEPGLGQSAAVLLPLIQLIIAVCFILRVQVDSANIAAMILFGIFFCVQSFAFWGGLDISCGCFGPQHSSRIGIGTLSFVGLLFLLSAGKVALPFFTNGKR
ncbi:hypothetical protein FACS189419_05950 [Planctomycetales bacterium]|nr:hypothetical protein FACS189419_05950 [Planctomycetales bacterium]